MSHSEKLRVLTERFQKANKEFELWYGRMKRAFNQMEKRRAKIIRLHNQIRKFVSEAQAIVEELDTVE